MIFIFLALMIAIIAIIGECRGPGKDMGTARFSSPILKENMDEFVYYDRGGKIHSHKGILVREKSGCRWQLWHDMRVPIGWESIVTPEKVPWLDGTLREISMNKLKYLVPLGVGVILAIGGGLVYYGFQTIAMIFVFVGVFWLLTSIRRAMLN